MPIILNGTTGITGVNAIDNVSGTELGYLDGVTSSVQAQINSKTTGGNGAWIVWTPQFNGTWANGNANASGAYIQIGNTVFFRGVIVIGSTTTKSGLMTIALPITAKNPGYSQNCQATLIDSGTNTYLGIGYIGGTNLSFKVPTVSGTLISIFPDANATTPFTWTTTDEVHFTGFYEIA